MLESTDSRTGSRCLSHYYQQAHHVPFAGHEPTAAILTFKPQISIYHNGADNAIIYLVPLYLTHLHILQALSDVKGN
jgi:hypothetical protein